VKLETLKPVAFLGTRAKEMIHRLYRLEARFLPIEVPHHAKLERVVQGLEPLGFWGAVFCDAPSEAALQLVERVTVGAEREGAVDVIAVSGGTFGSNVLEDAMLAALETAQYRGFGAHAVILGGGSAASAAVQLARAGLKTLTIAAQDRPAAEKLARHVPAGVSVRAISLNESALNDALEKADLLVICEPDLRMDSRLLQPYHMLLELSGETPLSVALERVGGRVIDWKQVSAHHLAAQLEFVTGMKFAASSLG
jgi:shikimate dehydrogenase